MRLKNIKFNKMKKLIGLVGLVLTVSCGELKNNGVNDAGYDVDSGNSYERECPDLDGLAPVNNRKPIVDIVLEGLVTTNIPGFEGEIYTIVGKEHEFKLKANDPDRRDGEDFWLMLIYGDGHGTGLFNIDDTNRVIKLPEDWYLVKRSHVFENNGVYETIAVAIDVYGCIGKKSVRIIVGE